ncbi:hypothetical protein ACFWWN_11265, partial [Streptomyces sp. NPDC059082]
GGPVGRGLTPGAAGSPPGAGGGALAVTWLQAHCRRQLAGYKVPRQLVLTERIQRSPSGKADYRWARAVAVEADSA